MAPAPQRAPAAGGGLKAPTARAPDGVAAAGANRMDRSAQRPPASADVGQAAPSAPTADAVGAPPPATVAPAQRLLRAAQSGDVAGVRAALADGAPADSADARGRTALMWAARRGDTASVRALLAAGADPTRTDGAGHTAADQARGAGHEALAQLIEQRRSGGGSAAPAGDSPVR